MSGMLVELVVLRVAVLAADARRLQQDLATGDAAAVGRSAGRLMQEAHSLARDGAHPTDLRRVMALAGCSFGVDT